MTPTLAQRMGQNFGLGLGDQEKGDVLDHQTLQFLEVLAVCSIVGPGKLAAKTDTVTKKKGDKPGDGRKTCCPAARRTLLESIENP